MDEISVDANGYVWVGGLKVFRLTPWGVIEFYDRDKRRAAKRNSHFVYAETRTLIQIICSLKGESNESVQSGASGEAAASPNND